jgi:hypothetical protein
MTQVGDNVVAVQYHHPTPYVQNYSFNFQYEAAKGLVVELGYSGNQGRKLLFGNALNIDQLPSSMLKLGDALNDQVANPFYGIFPRGPLSTPTVPRNRLLRPFPQFNAVNLTGDTPGASSSFNALVVNVTKRFSNGLQIVSGYQLSKSLDNSSENQGWEINDMLRDVTNLRADRSISAHDVPHSFVTNMLYELPVGKGKQFGAALPAVADAIVGGWQVSGILRFGSGYPLQATAPNNLNAFGFVIQRPNVSDLKILQPTQNPDRWFNTAAFTAPAAYTIGNAPRYFPNLRTRPTKEADIALMKNFPIREKWRAQFRAEFFNLTNRPQYGAADTNLASASFGKVSGTTNVGPRNIQIGLKVSF